MKRVLLGAAAVFLLVCGINAQAGNCKEQAKCVLDIDMFLSGALADWESSFEAAKSKPVDQPPTKQKMFRRLIRILGIEFLIKVVACGVTSDSKEELRACVKRLVNPPT